LGTMPIPGHDEVAFEDPGSSWCARARPDRIPFERGHRILGEQRDTLFAMDVGENLADLSPHWPGQRHA